jgi:hypothetical protein
MLIVLAAVPMLVVAQGGPPQGAPPQRPRAQARMQQQPDTAAAPNRAALERQVKARLGQMMKKQLGLTDAQMTKLQETNQKFDGKRRILVDQERDVRMSLRDEMLSADSTRSTEVSALLDRVVKVQRQRVDLLEQEQKELSTFLTPLQRAKYYGAEEQMRRRIQNMRLQQGQPALQGRGGQGGGGRGAQLRPGQGRGPARGGPLMQGPPPQQPPAPPIG